MWFRSMNFVVYPSSTLLYPQSPPLCIGQESHGLGQLLGDLLREDHMTILEMTVLILVTVFNLLGMMRHDG